MDDAGTGMQVDRYSDPCHIACMLLMWCRTTMAPDDVLHQCICLQLLVLGFVVVSLSQQAFGSRCQLVFFFV